MNKIFLTLLLSVFLTAGVFGQAYVMLDADMQPAKNERNAQYLLSVERENDTAWVKMLYDFAGPARYIETYRDRDLTIRHGRSIYYCRDGGMDTMCYFKDGLLHGPFSTRNTDGETTTVRKYFYGNLQPGEAWGEPEEEIDSSLYKKGTYPGGFEAWQKFLEKNCRYPKEAIRHGLQGTVKVRFKIDETGGMSVLYLSHSVAFWIDREAFRLMRRSSKWQAAEYKGNKVKSYYSQALTFGLLPKRPRKTNNP